MERPKTTKNVGQPCVICGQSADAQATIAALQARVPELEQAVKETHGRFISEQAAKKDVIEELTVALKSNADGQVLIDKLMQDVLKLEAQLTQRTAELEAANTLLYKKNCALGRAETSINDLQAELERVRALIKALPKVEGEIVAQAGYVKDRKKVYACFGSDADMTAYAAIVQHRQGMEG